MRSKLLIAVALLLPVAIGCQPRGEYEALHKELFQKESKIYELQSDIQQYRSVLDSCRRANLALEADRDGNADNRGLPGATTPRGNSSSTDRPRTPFLPTPEVPDVELPPEAEALPDIELPPGLDSNPSGPPPLFDGTSARYSPSNPVVARSVLASGKVQRIGLNKLLTGGFNMDGHPGDEGLLVVIEPRDKDDKIIEAAGEISIVLLDADSSGEQRRFARWDYSAEESKKFWRKSPLGSGLHFELPWPAEPPAHERMHVFVRMGTADGRKLSADKPIQIELLDGVSAVGLQRSIDNGLEKLAQPQVVLPQVVTEEPHLRSVLANSVLANSVLANSVLANSAEQATGSAPLPQPVAESARTVAEAASFGEPSIAIAPKIEPELAERKPATSEPSAPEKRTPLREAMRRPEWHPFR